MNGSMQRLAAIVKADFLVRFRRLSTAVIFLGLCISAYMWIPAPSTGRALLQFHQQRALYNSAALSLGTSALCTILLGIVGYYMISNTIKRDVQTRTGYIIASTTVKNWEYLTGKFLGNAVFLGSIVAGFMVSSMIMQLIRGEAPLEPLVFLKQYLLLAPALIVFLSGVAVFFESTRLLSGKFGDIVYFFLWIFTIAITAASSEKSGTPNWTQYIDTTGMAFVLHQVKMVANSNEMAIGSAEFDPSKPPLVFAGVGFAWSDLVPRLVSTFYPVLFLLPALLFFHRFNPTRLKQGSLKSHNSWIGKINGWIQPITRRLVALAQPGSSGGASFRKSVLSDAMLTFQLNPVAVLLAIIFSIVSITQAPQKVLPGIFAILAVILSDIATREGASGTTGIVFGSPFLKQRFILWKCGSAAVTTLLFIAIPLIKLTIANPYAGLGLLIGGLLTAAAATALGSMSSNPKTFIVVALLFLYLVVNDGGHNPGFDFAGWYNIAGAQVKMIYAGTAALFLALAELQYRWKLQRA